jgi:hypothetical protein
MQLFAHGESVKEHACTACRACTGYHHLQEQTMQRYVNVVCMRALLLQDICD